MRAFHSEPTHANDWRHRCLSRQCSHDCCGQVLMKWQTLPTAQAIKSAVHMCMQFYLDFVSCCTCVWEPCALRVCKRKFRTLQPSFTLHEYHICRKSKQGPNFLSIGGHRQSNYMDHPKDQQRLHLARLEGEKLHWSPRWKVVASDFLGFGIIIYSIHSTCMFYHGAGSTYILPSGKLT